MTGGVGSRRLVAGYSWGDASKGAFVGIYTPGGAAADPNYWNVRRYIQKILQAKVKKKL